MCKYFFLTILFFCQYSSALNEASVSVAISDIASFRMHSVEHQNGKAGNLGLIWVSTQLEENCNKLHFYADEDPFLFSTILSSFNNSKHSNAIIVYHTDSSERGPWGDSGSCEITSFTTKK